MAREVLGGQSGYDGGTLPPLLPGSLKIIHLGRARRGSLEDALQQTPIYGDTVMP